MDNYIRKAVLLADCFDIDEDHYVFELYVDGSVHYAAGSDPSETPQFFLDALAAQLVRQVDALESFAFNLYIDCARVVDRYTGVALAEIEGPDRTMNTLKAIIDSNVLGDKG